MKTQTKKRSAILSLLLGVMLIVATIPMMSVTAFAQTSENNELNSATNDEAKTVESIEIVKLPNQLNYIVGASRFIDLSGMEIQVKYTDGSTKLYSQGNYGEDGYYYDVCEEWPFTDPDFSYITIEHIDCSVDDYDVNCLDVNLGKNTITFKHYYSDLAVNFEINGIETPVEKLELTKLPDKILTDKFDKGFEVTSEMYSNASIAQDMDGAELKVYYKDETSNIFKFDGNSVMGIAGCPNYGEYLPNTGTMQYTIKVFDQWDYQAKLLFMGKSVVFTPNHTGDNRQAETILVDKNTNITVSGNISDDTILNIKNIKVNITGVKTAYDITLLKDGQPIQPNGAITISIPYNQDGHKIICVKEDGTTEDMNAIYNNGKYVFSVNHLSTFAIVDSKTNDAKDTNNNATATNDTANDITSSDNGIIATGKGNSVFLIVSIIAISGIIIFALNRKHNIQ